MEKEIREQFNFEGDFFCPEEVFFVENNVTVGCFSKSYVDLLAHVNYCRVKNFFISLLAIKFQGDVRKMEFYANLNRDIVDEPPKDPKEHALRYLKEFKHVLTYNATAAIVLYGYFYFLTKEYNCAHELRDLPYPEILDRFISKRFHLKTEPYRIVNGWLCSLEAPDKRWRSRDKTLQTWRLPTRDYFLKKFHKKYHPYFCNFECFKWVVNNCYTFNVTARFAIIPLLNAGSLLTNRQYLWLAFWGLRRGNREAARWSVPVTVKDMKDLSIRHHIPISNFTINSHPKYMQDYPEEITEHPKAFYQDKINAFKESLLNLQNKKYEIDSFVQIPSFHGDDCIVRIGGLPDINQKVIRYFPVIGCEIADNYRIPLSQIETYFIYKRKTPERTERYLVVLRRLPGLKTYEGIKNLDADDFRSLDAELLPYWYRHRKESPILDILTNGQYADKFKDGAFASDVYDEHEESVSGSVLMEIYKFIAEHDIIFGNLPLK